MTTASRGISPVLAFNFKVEFHDASLPSATEGGSIALCSGVFSEVTGLEASMEPKVIKVGGSNYGPAQRVGPVTFATVVLKRGVTQNQDLWKWFSLVAQGKSATRLNVAITMLDRTRAAMHVFKLVGALPTKFKAADLNAQASSVAIEELHLVHEGLTLERPTSAGGQPR